MKSVILGGLLGGLLLAAAAPGAAAPDIARLAAAYGARPSATSMQLSPGGERILYITSAGTQGRAVVVATIATGATTIILSSVKADSVPFDCNWKSEQRIICGVYYIVTAGAQQLSMRRTVSVAADGSSRVMLGQRPSDKAVGIDQGGGAVIDWLPDDPDHVLMQVNMVEQVTIGSNIGGKSGGLSVQKVDVNTGRMTMVERPNPLVFRYGADGQGNVRFMATGDSAATGYARDQITYMARGKTEKDWRRVATESLSGPARWTFVGFDQSGEGMFVLRDKDGRAALYRDGANPGEVGGLVYADPKVDVEGVLRIGKYSRPVAAIYTTDATQYAFFDPVLEKRARALSNALPGKPPIEILDESWDGKRNLVFAGGVADPGRYFRYDTATKQLSPLLAVRPELETLVAGVQTSVSYAAADGAQVPAYLTVPADPAAMKRPAIIMPHGGPGSRDVLGFDWLAQYFVQLGYVVLQPNFRGSTGYGEEWYAKNGFKSWEAAMGDINAGAHWLVKQGIADPARLAIFGWSYGGYAALQASIVDPGLYKAIVAVAPVTDLALLKRNSVNFTNYRVTANYIGEGPHVTAGSPAQNAQRLAPPVLMFHGDHDLNVDISQSRLMEDALKRAGKRHELVVYPGLAHSLDDSAARTDMLARSARWIGAEIGAR